ncbi:MAG: lipid-binding SYLF domain-containing protein [Pirellulales bacterium]|nr:lipid-binding SYLF domain-containing protein [Pirellulales bacterium]
MLSRQTMYRLGAFVLLMLASGRSFAQLPGEAAAPLVINPEASVVEASTQVLNEVMAVPAKSIPTSLLHDAQGIAIVPGMVKGGFVIGARFGRGILTTRTDAGAWTAPTFITITGGSIGWQAGVQSTDLILVFKTKKSIQGLLNGKFTIGADASAAAGPVGRDASVATDGRLQAEIYSYSRSRGLFAGVALDGSVIQIDPAATSRFYWNGGPPPPNETEQVLPPSAGLLLEAINRYTMPASQTTASTSPGLTPVTPPPIASQQITESLLDTSRALFKVVDNQWQAYLALPAEVYGAPNPSAPSLETALSRYEAVAANPQYQALTSRHEFQDTLTLLKSYAKLRDEPSMITLPPPPSAN